MTDTPPIPIPPQPGALRGAASLTLQTRQAQRLIRGRTAAAGKPAIVGLLGFANQLRIIWQGARCDDPYADWWLVKVHQALEQASEKLEALQAEVDQRMAAVPAIEIAPGESVQPFQVPLQFGNPFAFRGAQLLARFDDQIRSVLSAGHVGLLTRDETQRQLHQGGRAVRQAFVSSQGYRMVGVTRVDLGQGIAKANQAAESMGQVPREVIEGTLRAPYAPTRSNSNLVSQQPGDAEPQPDSA